MEKLDQEWIQLIFEAMEIGLNVEDIREFFLRQLDENRKEIFSE
ncbi:anti-repressor SinI family protein [Cytobacillus sp. FJAT-53684]|uniref:Anti-repressor SinI family protein n=1 Tax=Cytobacillus mangrovibacter TaxID=3299024 RepID=A0ABW6K043_9BACI